MIEAHRVTSQPNSAIELMKQALAAASSVTATLKADLAAAEMTGDVREIAAIRSQIARAKETEDVAERALTEATMGRVDDQHTDVDAMVRQAYSDLAHELARRSGGLRRGSQRRVAALLGVSPSTLSNILSKNRAVAVSDELLFRAEDRLGVPLAYYTSGDDPGEYLNNPKAIEVLGRFGEPRPVAPSTPDVAAEQYRKLVGEIGNILSHRRGWQRVAAANLGVSPSYLSKIVNRTVSAGDEAIRRAMEHLGLSEGYFSSDEDPAEWGVADMIDDPAEIRERLDEQRAYLAPLAPEGPGRPSPDAPEFMPALIAVHREALKRFRRGDGELESSGRELFDWLRRGVRFVALAQRLEIDRWRTEQGEFGPNPPRRENPAYVLLMTDFLREIAEMIDWVRANPDERTFFDEIERPTEE